MRKENFVNDYHFHLFNRGVDRRDIFLDVEDYQRFLHDMYEFNDSNDTPPFVRRIIKYPTVGHLVSYTNYQDTQCPRDTECLRVISQRDKLVEIYYYCLMPNHFHFVLEQLQDGGVSTFLHKLSMGYAKYFNLKYERTGSLFQGTFKAKLIETDAQMMHLSRYIHVLNPGEMVEPDIREGKVRDKERLFNFLKKFKWSSYLDYLDIRNYPSLINKDVLMGYFKDTEDFENFSLRWKREEISRIESLFIE